MLTVMHKATDRESFEAWVKVAKSGDICIYHTGLLMADRIDGLESLKVNDMANCTASAAARGFVHLVQKKLTNDCYQYLAVRSSKLSERSPLPPESALAA